jgi:hypothetical protein
MARRKAHDPGYGLDDRDEAGRWLAHMEGDRDCSHFFATIQPLANPLYRFCVECGARRPGAT